MQKKILSLLLALAMVVCTVPSVGITAMATEDVKAEDVVVDKNEDTTVENNDEADDANLENDKKTDGEVTTDGDKKTDDEVTTDGDKKPDGEVTTDGDKKPDGEVTTDDDKKPDGETNLEGNAPAEPDVPVLMAAPLAAGVPDSYVPGYAKMTTDALLLASDKELPQGVTITSSSMSEVGNEYSGKHEGEIHILIGENASGDLNIDLSTCIFKAFPADHISMPGNQYTFKIYIDNKSPYAYKYENNSFKLETENYDNFVYDDSFKRGTATGYDGQKFPVSFSATMIESKAIKALFDGSVPSGEEVFTINDKLKAAGFEGENALYNYLLDYYGKANNKTYASLEAVYADGKLERDSNFWSAKISLDKLHELCAAHPEIEKYVYFTGLFADGDAQFLLKWPDDKVAAFYYDLYYNDFLAFAYGDEIKELDSSGSDYARNRGVADYGPQTENYKKANSYFASQLNFAEGSLTSTAAVAEPSLVLKFTMDGPGLGNAYATYQSSFSNSFVLKQLKPVDPVVPEKPRDWTVSKSKTATNLDKNFESKVTLGLPSYEQELVSDIVFVLDKSTSAEVEGQALAMLKNLKARIAETGAKVKVGVVIFNKIANVTEFKDLATEYEAIEAAIKTDISSGTNTHAGMLAGKKMLDADTTVEASRKHLIFVSDGVTYMFNENPTAEAWSFKGDAWLTFASPDNWASKYGDDSAPKDWGKHLGAIRDQLKVQGTQYEYPYGGTVTKSTPEDINTYKQYANSIDKALYYTYNVYNECVKAGYNCYTMAANQNRGTGYKWGPSFMDYLAENSCGKDVTFDKIEKEIVYFLDAGSKVVDIIGEGVDDKGNEYDFAFIPEKDKLQMKVGGKAIAVKDITGEDKIPHFGFGRKLENEKYEYELIYNKEADIGENFEWLINVPVSNFERVELTYTVKLTNPQKAEGIYGQYDENGSKGYDALYTNVEATLFPVDTNGVRGDPEVFPKPTVDYEVKKHRPRPTPDDDDEEEKKPRPYPVIKPEQIPSTGSIL